MRAPFFFALLFLATSTVSSANPKPTCRPQPRDGTDAPLVGDVVTLDYGTFHGQKNEASGVISFKGIKFADAPVGNLRWRAPVSPPSKHLGDVNATQFANACLQASQSSVSSGFSEDCLFGNVFIPINTKVGDKLPVLVWFHGGGFQGGSTHDAPPEQLLQSSAKPMIFVSFEYRLGVFGFLGGAKIAGNGNLNAGLLDQREALRWVQDRIEKFGGDKTRVTIWGQSAGAGSTMFQLLANGGNPEGLFHAAMGDSPSLSFLPPFDGPYVEGIYNQVVNFAGCTNANGGDTLACLRSADVNKLASAGAKVLKAFPSTLFVFAPIIDKTFLTERPVEGFKSGRFAKVPVLFGANSDEGANWSAGLPDPHANTSEPNANETTVYNFLHGQYATLTQSSADKGFGMYPLTTFSNSVSLQGQQMYGEARYICSAVMISAGAFVNADQPAFQYHYDNPVLGSTHGAELRAFFSAPPQNDQANSALFKAMREYWTSFVTSGIPSSSNGIAWQAVNAQNGGKRLLLRPSAVGMEDVTEVLHDRCDFWHGLSKEINT